MYWSVFISGGNTTNSQCVKNMSNLLLFVRFGGDHCWICLNDQGADCLASLVPALREWATGLRQAGVDSNGGSGGSLGH